MKRLVISFFTIVCCASAISQSFTGSDLPIVIINTNGDSIPDEPKVLVNMDIIWNGTGQYNNVTDPPNHYSGLVGIETRGNSTQGYSKKTYSFEFRNAANQDSSLALLGMGKEEDWILHAMVIDKTQLRIPMSFYLSRRIGHYASDFRFVEVVLNGDYRGLYVACEKIKHDDDRVDIAKLDATDLTGDAVTGGYILRIDWLDYPQGFTSNHLAQGGYPMFFQWYYPKAVNIMPQQISYIQSWMGTFEEAVFASNYQNSSGVRYNDFINLNSFTDFLLINELSKNSDGYKLSTYIHKDRDSKGGKLTAGPIWDFDQTYGMSTVCSNDDYTGWTYLQNQPGCEDLESMPMWWQRFMADQVFINHMKCRWENMRSSFLHGDSINTWIDQNLATLHPSIDRNFVRWPFIGDLIWAEPYPVPQTYAEEITYMKIWIANRLAWMDANLPGTCNTTGIEEVELDSGLNFYPNPASSTVVVDLKNSGVVTLNDLTGNLHFKIHHVGGKLNIPVEGLPNGMYILALETKEGIKAKKLVIQH